VVAKNIGKNPFKRHLEVFLDAMVIPTCPHARTKHTHIRVHEAHALIQSKCRHTQAHKSVLTHAHAHTHTHTHTHTYTHTHTHTHTHAHTHTHTHTHTYSHTHTHTHIHTHTHTHTHTHRYSELLPLLIDKTWSVREEAAVTLGALVRHLLIIISRSVKACLRIGATQTQADVKCATLRA
jgi:hypothetical protein